MATGEGARGAAALLAGAELRGGARPETPFPAFRGLFGMGFGRGEPLWHG